MSPASSNPPLLAIVIDDEPAHQQLISESILSVYEQSEVEVRTYARADEALVELPAERLALIICDYQLGDASGVDWLPDFVRADVGPVILATSSGNQTIAAQAFKQGAMDYVEKDVIIQNPHSLRGIITEAIRKFKLLRANKDLARKLKIANSELEKSNQRLARLSDEAHRFVDDVAHEFRTPLAVIKEFASIIDDGIGGEVTPKQHEFLSHITDASRDLAQLIDDFLDSSKLKAHTLRVDRRPHRLDALIDEAWPVLENRAKAKSIRLRREAPTDLPEIYTDADKFKRSIINLVVNAIKFSNSDGEVLIRAEAARQGMVHVRVQDHGPGLPPEQVQQLFQRFRQHQGAVQTDQKGFGLGLCIVQEMVDINLGEVMVESQYGSGCTFSFTAPVNEHRAIVDAFMARAMSREATDTITALVVMDETRQSDAEEPLDARLNTICYPRDLVLPHDQGRACALIGACDDPTQWVTRLHERASSVDMAPLDITIVGAWPLAKASSPLKELLASRPHARA